jgi:hypothetical protein
MCACLPDSRFFFSKLVPTFYKTLASSLYHKSSDRTSSAAGSWQTLGNINSSKGSSQKPIQRPGKTSRKKEADEEEMTGISVSKSTATASTVSL